MLALRYLGQQKASRRILCWFLLWKRTSTAPATGVEVTSFHLVRGRDSWLGSFVTAHALDSPAPCANAATRVGCFIALSEPSRRQLIAAGLPEERIVVKPNFMPDP